MTRRGVDGLLITNLVNVRYLSGFQGSSGFIFIAKRRNIFVTDFRYAEEVETEFSDQRSRGGPGGKGTDWEIVIERGNRLSVITKLARDLGVRSLGFESSASYDFYASLLKSGFNRIKPLKGLVEGQRAVKDEEEITLIREAVRRAESAFTDVKPFIRLGRSERAIACMLEERLKKRGCNHIPFDIIVASGSNGAMPHAKTTEKRLSPGDLVVIDWGGEADGYFSDITRTVIMRGPDLAKKREIYGAVLTASRKAIASVRTGVEGNEVDSVARECIRDAGYGRYFGHGTGHGVGLEVHELPRITWTRRDILSANAVFTIEPGIYLPGVGGVRIEDMVVARGKGAEVLTALPRRLEIL